MSREGKEGQDVGSGDLRAGDIDVDQDVRDGDDTRG